MAERQVDDLDAVGAAVLVDPVQRINDIARLARAIVAQHANDDQVRLVGDALVIAVGGDAAAADDAGDVRAVAAAVHRRRAAGHEVLELQDAGRRDVRVRHEARVDDRDRHASAAAVVVPRRDLGAKTAHERGARACRGRRRRGRRQGRHANGRVERDVVGVVDRAERGGLGDDVERRHILVVDHAHGGALVQQFVDAYDGLVMDAKRILGSLYSDSDYPSKQDIAKKFRMDMAVFPVPTNDFRCQIGDDELTRIQQDVEQRVKVAQTQAMNDVWNRLFERVKHMAEKLADPKAIFRDTMVENTRELCELLPRLNFMDDPALEQMRQDVEASLLKHPEALRCDPDLRRDTAAEAKAIMDKMSALMGGAV